MFAKVKYPTTTLEINQSLEGETLETKIERILNNKEPIKDGAPIVYTERNEGVIAAYNIRTDRFEVACEAMDKVSKTELAKRHERHKEPEKSGTPEPTGDTTKTAAAGE